MKLATSPAILLTAGLLPALGIQSIDAQEPALASALPALMDSAGIPGLSIAVIRDGRITWTGAFGHLNDPDTTPVNDETAFAAASLSKPVFAYVVMRLAERGVFDIDKRLAEYLPYERLEHDDRYRLITARHVMTHSTGLRNWQAGKLELLFAPGDGFNYSGEGFVYLQKTVEHVTGLTLEQLARREVFEPLGMTRSSYVWRDTFEGNAATGSSGSDSPRGLPHHREGNAAHSLLTTAGDYARFVRAVLIREGLSDATLRDVLTPHNSARRPRNPTSGDSHVSWGLGWGLQDGRAGQAFFHWGDNGAWRCYVVAYPETRTGVVYFTNSFHGLSIARAIVSRVIDDDHWAVDWIDYEGYDDPERLARRTIQRAFLRSVQDGVRETRRLYAKQPATFDAGLLADVGEYLAARNVHRAALAAAKLNVAFFPDSAGAHDRYARTLLQAGRYEDAITEYQRVRTLDPHDTTVTSRIEWVGQRLAAVGGPVTLATDILERYVGDYGPRHITMSDGHLIYQRDGSSAYRLIPLSEDLFALDGNETFRVRFVADNDRPAHKVIGLYLDGSSDESLRAQEGGR